MDRLVKYKTFNQISRNVNESHFKTLRIMCVFRGGKSGIYVTQADKVYGFGYNQFGCLGLGLTDDYVFWPKLNPTLSDKQLIDLALGYNHCLALTRSGQCYSWGGNKFGQLGTGIEEMSPTPQLIAELSHERLVQISCGNAHNLVLTDSGRVYSWGRNYFGECGNKCQPICFRPTLIEFDSPVKSVSCGKTHSMALLANGLVYIWGNNNSGQLGRKRIFDEMRPDGRQRAVSCRTPLPLDSLAKRVVIKAECGPNHSLVLTSDGDIYAFGNNECGQIGNGSQDIQHSAIKINGDIKFKDIATSYDCDISIGLSVANEYYVWGLCDKQVVSIPREVSSSADQSMFDIYANYAKRVITYRAIVNITEEKTDLDQTIGDKEDNKTTDDLIQGFNIFGSNSLMSSSQTHIDSNVRKAFSETSKKYSSELFESLGFQTNTLSTDPDLNSCDSSSSNPEMNSELSEQSVESVIIKPNAFLNRLSNSFNNPNDYDIRFNVDNQYIYCHKTILRIRNQKFWQKYEQYLNESNDEIVIQGYSYQTFLLFVQYLYTNSLYIDDIESASDLLSLATDYDEEVLIRMCRQLLDSYIDPNLIDVKNVCKLYIKAIEQNSKELEKICIEFVSKHMKQIYLSKEFRQMNDSLAKSLIIDAFNQ